MRGVAFVFNGFAESVECLTIGQESLAVLWLDYLHVSFVQFNTRAILEAQRTVIVLKTQFCRGGVAKRCRDPGFAPDEATQFCLRQFLELRNDLNGATSSSNDTDTLVGVFEADQCLAWVQERLLHDT
jgi:hypothetical protein